MMAATTMGLLEAARNLRDQFKAQGDPAPWCECMRLAAECKRQDAAKSSESPDRAVARAKWFRAFKAKQAEREFLDRLHATGKLTKIQHAAKNAVEKDTEIREFYDIDQERRQRAVA